MSRYGKYLPLLAGPVLFLLFSVTEALIGPPRPGPERETVYELVHRLSQRTAALAEAKEALAAAERYLAASRPAGGEGSSFLPADPAVEWAPMMATLPSGSYHWQRAVDRDSTRYELTLRASFPALFRWLGELDRRKPGFEIRRLRLSGEGENVVLDLVVVPVGGGERG